MKISVFVYGSRGDVQPMLALAVALMKKGHEILFIANPENEEFVRSYGCDFRPFGPNVKEQMALNAAKKRSPFKFSLNSFGDFKKITEEQVTRLPELIRGSDLVLNAGLGLGVHTAAEVMKIPYRFVIFYPMILGSGSSATLIDKIKAKLMNSMSDSYLKGMINRHRKEAGIPPVDVVSLNWLGDHVIVAADVALNRVKEGVDVRYTQTGYLYLESKNSLPEGVGEFISSGDPPVFIGFGSNPIYYPQELTQMLDRISGSTGQRLIISKGWADLEGTGSSSGVLYVDDVPYELLFPEMAAVIHHGGTGTMSYAARAGVPQAGFPFMTDQFVNRDQIARLGIGPKTCDFKKMTENEIAAAISDCVSKEHYKKNALEISEKIKSTDGVSLTVQLIEAEFSV